MGARSRSSPAPLVAEQLRASGTAGEVRVVRAVDRGAAQSDVDIVKACLRPDTTRVVLLRIAEVDGEPRLSLLVYGRDGELVSAATASPGVPISRPPDQGVPRALELVAQPPPPAATDGGAEVSEARGPSRDSSDESTVSVGRIVVFSLGSTFLTAGVVGLILGSRLRCPGCSRRTATLTLGGMATVLGGALLVVGIAMGPSSGSSPAKRQARARTRLQVGTLVSRGELGLQLGGRF